MSNRVPTIAVITSNSLMGVGLKSLLNEIIPFAVVEVCGVEQIIDSSPEEHFHIFVSVNIALENISLFEKLRTKTILLTNGSSLSTALSGYARVDVSGSAFSVREQLLSLHSSAHHHQPAVESDRAEVLTPREIEVLSLLVDGMLNKEVANALGIGLTTVISHRKNIVEKLGVRSLSGLTIYAVMKGYIEI